ncbi:MAG: hypothetical protein K2G99_03700 [Desulfovibrio sp.]|nr:hypothetical protein [Desulfovibrio sp.]
MNHLRHPGIFTALALALCLVCAAAESRADGPNREVRAGIFNYEGNNSCN